MTIRPITTLVVLVVGLSACGTMTASSPPTSPRTTHLATAHRQRTARTTACRLRSTFDYIERDVLPGSPATAFAFGNINYSACTSSIASFMAGAPTGHGECYSVAKASDNPGYEAKYIYAANAPPPPPLKHVIEEAGPGCGS